MRYIDFVRHRNYRHVIPVVTLLASFFIGLVWLSNGGHSLSRQAYLNGGLLVIAGIYIGKYVTEYRLKPYLDTNDPDYPE